MHLSALSIMYVCTAVVCNVIQMSFVVVHSVLRCHVAFQYASMSVCVTYPLIPRRWHGYHTAL
jgi:hypothetical protein